MATATYRGTLAPLLQRRSETYSQNTGYIREFEYRGMSEERARALAGSYANAGCDYSLQISHGISTLVTTDSTGSITIDTWEIGANEVSVSSFKNPLNNSKLLSLSTRDRARFLEGVQNRWDWDYLYSRLTDTENEDALQRAYNRFLDGSDSYFAQQFVLRHTTNVSNRYRLNVADNNVGHIYTPAQFLSEVRSAGYWLFPMPQAFVNALAANPAPAPVAGYLWGYLKGASNRTTAANNRINIVTEYKQFLWSTDEYGTI